VAGFADAVVVGSAIINHIAEGVKNRKANAEIVEEAVGFCKVLADSVHVARATAVVE
jgi:tryptophan synthase alpha subunit